MTTFTYHPIFRLFFDLTVNDGWNGVALATYGLIIGLTAAYKLEKRKGN